MADSELKVFFDLYDPQPFLAYNMRFRGSCSALYAVPIPT